MMQLAITGKWNCLMVAVAAQSAEFARFGLGSALTVSYKDFHIGTYFADIIVEDILMIELKPPVSPCAF
jgi:PD-(D/E)XK nuclease superfamily